MMPSSMCEKRRVSFCTWFLSTCEMVPLNMIPLSLCDGSSVHNSSAYLLVRWFLWTWFLYVWEMVPLCMIPHCHSTCQMVPLHFAYDFSMLERWFICAWFHLRVRWFLLPWFLSACEMIPLHMSPLCLPLSLWDDSSTYESYMLVRWFLCPWFFSPCEVVSLNIFLSACEMVPVYDSSVLVKWPWFLSVCQMIPLHMITLYLRNGSSVHDSSLLMRWCLWTWLLCACEMVPLHMIPLCTLRFLCIWNVHMRYHILYPWDGSFGPLVFCKYVLSKMLLPLANLTSVYQETGQKQVSTLDSRNYMRNFGKYRLSKTYHDP